MYIPFNKVMSTAIKRFNNRIDQYKVCHEQRQNQSIFLTIPSNLFEQLYITKGHACKLYFNDVPLLYNSQFSHPITLLILWHFITLYTRIQFSNIPINAFPVPIIFSTTRRSIYTKCTVAKLHANVA